VAREFAGAGCVCRGRGSLQSVGELAGVGELCRGSEAFAGGGENLQWVGRYAGGIVCGGVCRGWV